MKKHLTRRFALAAPLALAMSPALAATEVAIGAYVIPGSPGARLFQDFAAQLKDRSQGALTTNMLIHGEGGSEEQVLTALRRGRIHVASLSTLVLSSVMPEVGVLSAPFLYDSIDQADFVLDNFVIPRVNELAAEKGLVALRWMDLGPQNIYSKSPILSPADVRGVRIRVTQDIATKLYLEALKADVIYLPSPDVIPALQTGLIDGGVTPTIAYAETGIVSDAPHYTLVGFSQVGNVIVANKKWLDDLPLNLSTVVRESYSSNAEIRSVLRTLVAGSLARAAELKFTAHTPDAAQMAQWRAGAEGIAAKVITDIGGQSQRLYDAVQEGRKAFAANN